MFDCFIITVYQQKLKNFRKNINQVINKLYYSARPRVNFLSRPMIKPGAKDQISEYKKKVDPEKCSITLLLPYVN